MRLQGRKVLVTGGAGFLGSHLCEKLLAEGAKVRALDLLTSGRETNLCAVREQMDFWNCTIACEEFVRKASEGVDSIVHLAFPMVLRQQAMETKVISEIMAGLFHLIGAAQEHNALLVYISSIAVYGNEKYTPIDESHPLEPVLIHGAVKLAGECFCRTMAQSNGLRTVILRVADIYGPRNTRVSVPIKFLTQAVQNKPITIYGDGSDSRTYTFVSDFSEAVVLSLIRPGATGGVFNIGSDECVSMCELAQMVKQITGSSSPLLFEERPASGRRLLISSQKSKDVLGFEPAFDMARGLSMTHQWLKENPGYYPS